MKKYDEMAHLQEWRDNQMENLHWASKFVEHQTNIVIERVRRGLAHGEAVREHMERIESLALEVAQGGMPNTVQALKETAEKKPIYELMEEWANAKPDDEGVIDLISEAVWEHPLEEIMDFFDPKGRITERLDEEMYWYVEWRREELQKAEDE